jgi:hypothetical protein
VPAPTFIISYVAAPASPQQSLESRNVPVTSAIPDIPSPTKDLDSLERMDPSNANIIPFQNLASQTSLGQAVRNGQFASMTYVQYANDLHDPRPSAGIQDPFLQPHYPDLHGQPCCNDVCALGLLGALFMGLIYENSGPAS